nr:outer membrane beta-barrel protein [Cesiribacter andamanensis]
MSTSSAQIDAVDTLLTTSVTGQVVDASDCRPLGYVTASLRAPQTKHPLASAITNPEGHFILADLPKQDYILELSHVGYSTISIPLSGADGSILSLGQLALSLHAALLEEVVVLGPPLLIEQDADKLTYHAALDPDSRSLSALDMLGKVPMLSLDGDNKLRLNGSSSYQVLINGQVSSLFVHNPSDVLRSMPASAIKSIEVITHPPARFGTELTGGIINIITHHKTVNGYTGSATATLSNPRGTNLNSYLSGKMGKLGFSGQLGRTTITDPPAVSSFLREEYQQHTRLQQSGESTSHSLATYAGAELSIAVSPQSLLTASYRRNSNTNEQDFKQQARLYENRQVLVETYENRSLAKGRSGSGDLSIDFQQFFKKRPEQLLSLRYRASLQAHTFSSDFVLDPLEPEGRQLSQTQNTNDIRDYVLQADYVQPFNRQLMEIGLMSTLRQNGSSYYYSTQDQKTGRFDIDPSQSNIFDYQQEIHAMYLSFNLKKNGGDSGQAPGWRRPG